MTPAEIKGMSPEEMISEIEGSHNRYRENKYAFQVGLKDVDFDIDQCLIEESGLVIPFSNVILAESALKMNAIRPTIFFEYDGTPHQVIHFDHRPIGYSGFMNCVLHSLSLTNSGLFEVGRYPAINMAEQNRYWQWFLHRRLATKTEFDSWQEERYSSADELMEQVYSALIANP